MTKDIDRRLGKLEKTVSAGRIICALDTSTNHALVECGLMPDLPGAEPPPDVSRRKRFRAWLESHNRLGKRDTVVFLSEAEMML